MCRNLRPILANNYCEICYEITAGYNSRQCNYTNSIDMYVYQLLCNICIITRMHSSRMRTACLLPVSPRMHCGGSTPQGGWVSAPGGVCFWGVSASGGCLLLEGGLLSGDCLLPGGVYISMQWGRSPL